MKLLGKTALLGGFGVNWLNSNLILHAIATGHQARDVGNVVNEVAHTVPIGNGKPDR